MKIKDWSELHSISGELSGIALAMDWSEDVDLKKVKVSLEKLSTKVYEIAQKENDKLEDMKPSIQPDKKQPVKPAPKTPTVKPTPIAKEDVRQP